MTALSAPAMIAMMRPVATASRKVHHATFWSGAGPDRLRRLPGKRLVTGRDELAAPTAAELSHLVLRVARSDRQAFEQLFRHFAPRVKAYILRGGAEPGLAEEVAQETLLAVWRKASGFDPAKAGAATWIFTIARNLRIDRARRKGPPPTLGEDPSQQAEAPPAADEVIAAAERDDRVRRLVETLPAEQAEVLRLSFFAEEPQTEIAALLGIPLGTVKSRVRLAMARLRTALEDLER